MSATPGNKNNGNRKTQVSETDSDARVKDLFAAVAKDIDFMSSLFSFWLDELWRRKLVSIIGLKGGEQVLDICSGTGKLAVLLSKKLGPGGSLTAADFSPEMLDIARERFSGNNGNINFVITNSRDLDFPPGSFDLVTVAFGIRNIVNPEGVLNEVRKVLKPGGSFYCLELTRPADGWFRPIYDYYSFKVMPYVAKKMLSSEDPYNYLPQSIMDFHSPGDFARLIGECGFRDVSTHIMSLGTATIFGAKKEA